MSAETKAVLDQAIRDHFKSFDGGEEYFVSEWALVAAGVIPDTEAESRTYCYEDSDLAIHHHIGLVRRHLIRFEERDNDDD